MESGSRVSHLCWGATTAQSCMRSSGRSRLGLWRNTMESQMCGCRRSARPFACHGLVAVIVIVMQEPLQTRILQGKT